MYRRALLCVVALLAACAACAPPALASPSVATPMACWIWGGRPQPLPVAGSGFSPGAALDVAVAGTPVGSWRTDSAGDLAAAAPEPPQFSAGDPPFWTAPRAIALQVLSDSPSQPQVLATMRVPTVWRGSQLLVPGLSRSRSRRARSPFQLQAGGAPDGQPFYLHYAYSGKRHRLVFGTFRLGAASGPCGTLDVRFDMFRRIRPQVGSWNIWSDTLPRIPRSLERATLISAFTFFALSRARDGTWVERFP